MKKIQLIEWGIITIGLIFGYKFFEGVFTALVQIFYGFQVRGGDIFVALLPTILLLAVYAACFIWLIRKSSQLAHYLSGGNVEEDGAFKIGKRSLLQVVLISICLATILSNIADILLYLFETFKREAGRRNFLEENTNTVNKYAFKIAAVRTIVSVVVLFFYKEITNWFIRKNEADELTFETEPENKQ